MNITKVNDRRAIIKLSQEDLAKYDLNKFIGTDGWSSRRTVVQYLPFERVAAIEFEKKYTKHNAGVLESATLNTTDNSVDITLRISKNRKDGLTKPEINQPSIDIKTLASLSADDKNSTAIKQLNKDSFMKNIIFLNSRTASVSVEPTDFGGTELEVAKLARHIGQYGNVVSYKVLPGTKVSKVIFMLNEDAEEFLSKKSEISKNSTTAKTAIAENAFSFNLEDFNKYALAVETELTSKVASGECSVKEAAVAYEQLLQHYAYEAGIGKEQMENTVGDLTPEEKSRLDFINSLPEELSTKFVNTLRQISNNVKGPEQEQAINDFVEQFKYENGLNSGSDMGIGGDTDGLKYLSVKSPEGETLGWLSYTTDESGTILLDDMDGNSEIMKPLLYGIEENPNITRDGLQELLSQVGEPVALVDEVAKPDMNFDFGYGTVGEDNIDDIADVSNLTFDNTEDSTVIDDAGNMTSQDDDESRTAAIKLADTVDPITGQPIQQPMIDQSMQPAAVAPMATQPVGVGQPQPIAPADPNVMQQQPVDLNQQPIDQFGGQQVAASVK